MMKRVAAAESMISSTAFLEDPEDKAPVPVPARVDRVKARFANARLGPEWWSMLRDIS